MTNRLSVILGGAFTAAIVLDMLVFGGAGTLFMLKKIADLADWMAFWH